MPPSREVGTVEEADLKTLEDLARRVYRLLREEARLERERLPASRRPKELV